MLVLKQREGLEAEEPSKKTGELSELNQEQRSRGFYIDTLYCMDIPVKIILYFLFQIFGIIRIDSE